MLEARGIMQNVLVLAGGWYLSSWVAAPLWLPVTHFTTNRVYHPGLEAFAVESVMIAPRIVGAFLAGFAGGYLIETLRPARWAVGFGIIVAAWGWLSFRWQITPDVQQRLGQLVKAVLPGMAAWAGVRAGYLFVQKRRTPSVESGA